MRVSSSAIFSNNAIAKFINNFIFRYLVTSLSAAYYSIITFSNLEIVNNNKTTLEGVAIFLIILLFALGLFWAAADQDKENSSEKYNNVMENILALCKGIVIFKKERFSDALKNLRRTNIFKQITKPHEQVRAMGKGGIEMICKVFDISDDKIDMTIMEKDPTTKSWDYIYKHHDGWNRRKASEIMRNKQSAAFESYKTGENLYYINKDKAEIEGHYWKCERDQKAGNGSIICIPLKFDTDNEAISYEYIISITTYGVILCDELDDQAISAVTMIVDQLVTRLSLELSLLSIIKHRPSNKEAA